MSGRTPRPPSRRQLIEELEPRLLFSADLNVVLVDTSVQDAQVVEQAASEADILHLYDGSRESAADVLSEVTARALATGGRIGSLSILSQGAQGGFRLGNETISQETLDANAAAFEKLRAAMAEGANLYLFGCDVNEAPGDGTDLLDALGELTGADVFATEGGATGSWELERASSGDEAELASGLATPLDLERLNGYLGQPEAASETLSQRRELVVLDPAVQNADSLLELFSAQRDAGRQLEIVVLDGERDGVAQIGEILAGRSDLDSVHVLSHGTEEGMQLGDTWLDAASLDPHAEAIQAWSAAFGADGDLLLYGCDLAASEAGRSLVTTLGQWTGTDVAASDDPTGNALFGGDWSLEFQAGRIETAAVASAAVQQQWVGLMAVAVDDVSNGTAATGASSVTVSHTTSGSNRLMLVAVSFGEDKGESVSSVTYGGTALSRVGAQDGPDPDQARVEIWSLVAPDLGTHDVVVTFSGTGHEGATVGAMTFSGVDASTPLGSFASANGSDTTPTTSVSSAAGEIVFGAAAFNDGTDRDFSPGAGQTEQWDLFRDKANGSATTEAGAASVVTSWTLPTSGDWAAAGVSIRPAPPNVGAVVWNPGGSATPQTSAFDGSSFSAATPTANIGGPWRIIAGAEAPGRDEKIVVGVDASGNLSGQIFDGSAWTAFSPVDFDSVSESSWWGFDVAYEQQSGHALLVYNDGSGGTSPLSYRVWNGSSWSGPTSISVSAGVSGEAQQLRLEANPASDEMVLVVSNSSSEDYALVWDGSSWGNEQILDTGSGNDRTDVSVAYERQSGHAMVVYGKAGTDAHYRLWDGSSWSAEGTVSAPGSVSGYARWTTLASDPNSNRIALGALSDGDDVWLAVWDGSAWEASVAATTSAVGDIFPNLAVAFESSSGQALATYGEASSTVRYRTWANGSGWSGELGGPDIGGTPNSMTLDSDPESDRIVLSVQDGGEDLNLAVWDGSSWGSPTELETTTGENENQPFLFLWNQAPQSANPTLVVDTTSDVSDGDTSSIQALLADRGGDGFISLREAIEAANATANGGRPDEIHFAIGSGLQTIAVGAGGLDIVTDPVILDATTQPGYAGTPLIQLDGTGATGSTAGLALRTDHSVIRGFIVHSFPDEGLEIGGATGFGDHNVLENNWVGIDSTGAARGNQDNGILVTDNATGNRIGGTGPNQGNIISGNASAGLVIRNAGSDGNLIQGNWVGLAPDGSTAVANATNGIEVLNTASGTRIGGTEPGAGNVVSGNTYDGIRVVAATGTVVEGNLVGTDVTGAAGVGNGDDGISLQGGTTGTLVGGTSAAARNVFAANLGAGVYMADATTTGNTVHGNIIGTDVSGTLALGNGGVGADSGVRFFNAGANTVGGIGAGEGNLIANSGRYGVEVGGTSTGITIRGNSIFATAGIGIDLEGGTENADLVTTNDAGDADAGANELQNHPVLTKASVTGSEIVLAGYLDSTASASFAIDFYSNPAADPSGHGEGQTYLGSTTVTTDANGRGVFHVAFGAAVPAGAAVSATATAVSSGSTSEFGAVATTAASGPTLWLSTETDVTAPSGVNGLAAAGLRGGDVLELGGPTLAFEPGVSNGSFSVVGNFNDQVVPGNGRINAMHRVGRDMLLAGGQSVQRGDLLLSFFDSETVVSSDTSTLAVDRGDVVRFRPDAAGDYSTGTFSILVDGSDLGLTSLMGVSLVERDTTVGVGGGATGLVEGDLLLVNWHAGATPSAGADPQEIVLLRPTDLGATTAGSVSVLIDGADLGLGAGQSFTGVDLVEVDAEIGGTSLVSGQILASVDGAYTLDGTPVQQQDVFVIAPTATGAATTATVSVLLEGADVGLDTWQEDVRGLSLVNDHPVVGTSAGAASYTEGSAPVVIDSAISVGDDDSTDFASGTLTVELTANGSAPDRLAIRDQGPGVGNVALAGSDVSYDFGSGPVVIGSFSGGTDGSTPLVVVFNASADAVAVQAVARNVTFENLSDAPSLAARTVSFVVTDGDGGSSGEQTKTVNVVGVNDDPVVTLPGVGVAYTENGPATVIDATATVVDPDLVDFATGTLTVDFTANGTANDRLEIRDVGTGAGQIGVSGANVSYGGVTIGSFVGGTDGSTPLVVTLNANASAAAVQELARNVTYRNTSDDPSALARTVRFVLADGDGGTSSAVSQTVNVTAVNDAPTLGASSLTISEGATVVLSGANLSASDPEDAAGTLVFSVSNVVGGSFERISSGLPVFSFSQADVTGSDIRFVHDGGEGAPGFDVTVTDGGLLDDGPQAASIVFSNVNDAPTLGDAALAAVVAGNPDPPGETIVNLFGGAFSDPDGSLAGIAVVGNSAPAVQGSWQYSSDGGTSWADVGTVADGATALAIEETSLLRFVPNGSFSGTPTALTVRALDDVYGGSWSTTNGGETRVTVDTASPGGSSAISTPTATLNTLVQEPPAFWLSTWGDGNVPGAGAFEDGSALRFGDPSLAFEPGTTSGTFSSAFDLDDFATGDTDIDAMHLVGRNLTVGGGANTFDLLVGDLLFSVDGSETLSGLAVDDRDVVVFRPTVAGNYGAGSFFLLLDNVADNDMVAFSLVEQDTLIGDTTVSAGSFLYADSEWDGEDGTSNDENILVFDATGVGSGTTTGSRQTLIDGSDVSIAEPIDALALVQTDTIIAGRSLPAGRLLLSVADGDTVGSNNLSVNDEDMFELVVTSTELTPGATAATALAFFDGSDVSLTDGNEDVNALTLVPTTDNVAPVLADNALTLREGETVTLDGSNLNAWDADDAYGGLGFTVSGVTNGHFERTSSPGVAITTFLQSEVAAGDIVFVHDGGEAAPSYSVTVSDGSLGDGPQAASITFSNVNDDPTVTNLVGDVLGYLEGSGPLVVEQGADALVSDVDSSDFDGGRLQVTLSSGGDPAEDVLSIRDQGVGAGQIGFSGGVVAYGGLVIGAAGGGSDGNPLTVVLNGNASLAAVSALVHNVTYENTDGVAATLGSRALDFELHDGDGGQTTACATVTVFNANVAPTISGAVAGQAVDDDATLSPFSGVTIGDPDVPTQTLSVDVSLDVAAQGVLTNLGGFLDLGGGTYRFSGTAAAATTAIRGLVFDPAENRVAAGSTETTTFTISVDDGIAIPVTNSVTTVVTTSVNDAPSLGDAILAAANEDDPNPPGATLAALFAGSFSDVDASASLAGVAVVGNAAPSAEGVWQYSSDGGTTWADVGAVSDGAGALAVQSTSLFRFLPAADFDGAPTDLIVRGLDDSYGGSFSTTPGVEVRVDVDTGSPGGSSPIAAVTSSVSTSLIPQNDAPSLDVNTLTISEGGTVLITDLELEASDVDDGAGDLSFTVSSVSGGQFERVSNPGVAITSFSQTEVTANDIRFVHDGNEAAPSYDVTVSDFSLSTGPQAATIFFTGVNDDPALSLPGGALGYTEDDPATAIDATATVTDPDGVDFDTGTLTVDFMANGTADDRLEILDVGTGAGQIGVSGANVTYGGVLIGTFGGGSDGSTPLVVTLNANADVAAVQELARNVAYRNVSDTPSTAARTIRFVVTDGDGGTSPGVTQTVNVAVTNDAPVVTLPGAAVGYTENDPATVVDAAATVADVDSSDFAGGSLTVDFSVGGSADDRLEIRNVGTGAGQIGVSGANVTYGGVLIGTFVGGTDGSTPLVVTLNANADAAAVQELARNVSFRSVSDAPSTAARSVRFLVADGDGGTSTAVTQTVNVSAVNDDPALTLPGAAVGYTENDPATMIDATAMVSDPDGVDFDTGTLTVDFAANGTANDRLEIRNVGTGAGQIGVSGANVSYGGVLIGTFVGGTDGSTPLVVTLGANADAAAIQELARNVSYRNVSDAPSTAPRAVRFVVTDGDGGTSPAATQTVNVGALNDDPTLTLPGAAAGYTENDPATMIDATATVSDPDGVDFDTGTLTVDFTANGTANDRLEIRNVGTGAGQIGVSGANVTYGGVLIGTFAGGTDGSTPLVVTLGANADAAAVQELARNVSYRNTSDTPSTAARTLRFVVTDGDGATSAAVTQTVNLATVNDAPTLTLPGGTASYIENAPATLLDPAGSVADVDSVDFDSGTLTVDFTAGGTANDRLEIRNVGPGAGQIGVSGATVSYGGVTIGSFVGGSDGSTPLVITLNANADAASVSALVQNVGYRNVSEDPSELPRTLRFVLADGDGGTSVATSKALDVTAVNDQPVASDATWSISENSASGSVLGSVAASDVDASQSLSWSITGGNGLGVFFIDPATGSLRVANNANLDHELSDQQILTITVTDSGSPGLSDTATVTVDVLDVNETPAATNRTFTIPPEQTSGAVVGNVDASDPDDGDSVTYRIVSGNLGGAFAIDPASGVITVADPAALDFATNPVFNLLIEVEDASSLVDSAFITVNLEETPPPPEPPPPLPDPPPPPEPEPEPDPDDPPDEEEAEEEEGARVALTSEPDPVPVAPSLPPVAARGSFEREREVFVGRAPEAEGAVAQSEEIAVTFASAALEGPEISVGVWNALDQLGDELSRALEDQESEALILSGALKGSSLAMAAGFLTWFLRGGTLLTSLLSTLPLWSRMDPLPVLAAARDEDEDARSDEEREEEERVARILDRGPGA